MLRRLVTVAAFSALAGTSALAGQQGEVGSRRGATERPSASPVRTERPPIVDGELVP